MQVEVVKAPSLPDTLRVLKSDGAASTFLPGTVQVLVAWEDSKSFEERFELEFEDRPDDCFIILYDKDGKEYWLVKIAHHFDDGLDKYIRTYRAQLLSYEELAAYHTSLNIGLPADVMGKLKHLQFVQSNAKAVPIDEGDIVNYTAKALAARCKELLRHHIGLYPLKMDTIWWVNLLAQHLIDRLEVAGDKQSKELLTSGLQGFRKAHCEMQSAPDAVAEERQIKPGKPYLPDLQDACNPREETLRGEYEKYVVELVRNADQILEKYENQSATGGSKICESQGAGEFKAESQAIAQNSADQILPPAQKAAILLEFTPSEKQELAKKFVSDLFGHDGVLECHDAPLSKIAKELQDKQSKATLVAIFIAYSRKDSGKRKMRFATWSDADCIAQYFVGHSPNETVRRQLINKLGLPLKEALQGKGGQPKSNNTVLKFVKMIENS